MITASIVHRIHIGYWDDSIRHTVSRLSERICEMIVEKGIRKGLFYRAGTYWYVPRRLHLLDTLEIKKS
jgi:hypothetical protein